MPWRTWKACMSSSRASLVDRDLVGDQDPVRALEVLHVEDLRVDVGRVVDDDQHLGLRVEVRPRAVDDVVEVELSRIGHSPSYQDRSRIRRSISCSTSSGSLPARTRRALRASTCCADLVAQLVVDDGAGGIGLRARQRGELGLDVQRRLAAAHAARVACLEHLADLHVTLGVGAHRRGAAAVLLVGEPAAADLAVAAARPDQRVDRDEHAHRGDHPDERPERILHVRMIAGAPPRASSRRHRL